MRGQRSCRGRVLPKTWCAACRPPLPLRQTMSNSPVTWCRRWDRRPSGPTTPPTSAASTTRGFSELVRLGRACGARSETMAGLSGLGDLILTCSSPQSRNFALGLALGRGERPPRDRLAEGEFTAPVLIELAASQNVDMPVSNAVAAILSGAVTIDAAIESLLTRPFKAEG